ncbi:hypothetical protein BLS_001768 [Venturia inaequalis]|uniref:Uncharacterized protein n=1 Tax=Venturia inaequalis TaxID=5025 RepID=A0A8H3Z138_VENIN|nr:hypothetical protein BLS_001768 [Venturia inaequalis]
MSATVPKKTAAIIYNSGLPEPLGGLGAYIASQQVANSVSHLNPILVDLNSFLLHHPSDISPDVKNRQVAEAAPVYNHQAFQNAMSLHSGYFFVFPGHVWAHTRLIKQMVSLLPRHVYANKPTAVVTYTREDTRPWHRNQTNNSYEHVPRNSAAMMAEFLSQLAAPEDTDLLSLPRSTSTLNSSAAGRRRGFSMAQLPLGYDSQPVAWPEFTFFWDLWDAFPSTNPIWPGGNQDESWEASGWGKCITVANIMMKTIEPAKS